MFYGLLYNELSAKKINKELEMKKNNLKKIAATSMLLLSLGGPVVTSAASQSTGDSANISNQVEEQLTIKNGDFNEGLNHWIVSSPGTQNPTIEELSGNKYAVATYGENIHQYLALKPNTTYTFGYDVAGSADFSAKVEFGTMNHDEGFISLEETSHNNENWTRREFTFTTPETDNTYIIRFSSTGNGWAKFDNIQVEPEKTETSLLTVGTQDREAYAYLNLDAERFNSSERLMVYVDGRYHFETYKGKAYYSFTSKTDEGTQVRRSISGVKGQVIEVYTAPNSPGHSSTGKRLLESITLEEDLAVDTSLLEHAVKNIQLSGNRLDVDFDRASFEGNNRMIIRKNGAYVAEIHKGKVYYASVRERAEDSVKVSKTIDYKAGDVISVELSSGTPGGSSNSLQVLATYEVE